MKSNSAIPMPFTQTTHIPIPIQIQIRNVKEPNSINYNQSIEPIKSNQIPIKSNQIPIKSNQMLNRTKSHSTFFTIIIIILFNQFIIKTTLTSNLEFKLYKRSTNQNRFLHAKTNLINKYSSTHSTNSLQKRQISVPIISNLSNSNHQKTNSNNNLNYNNNNNNNLTIKGISDGRGGVIGLQPTYNFQADLEYFITIQIGNNNSPKSTITTQSLNIILDTGSSDFWVTSKNCSIFNNGCDSNLLNKFDSSFSNSTNLPFSIKYGSGSATGKTFIDNITFAGYHLTNQQFGVVDTVSSELLSKDVSGLMGLGFQTLSSTGIKPIWQTILSNPTQYNLSFPGFSFALTRFINQTTVSEIEPGGLFTIGTLNSSLFEGEIEFIPLPIGLESYWLIPMESISINGFSLDLSNQKTKNVAIDTGTTLIGGPIDEVKNFYNQIPGSLPATGSYQGYYSYPCNSSISLNFKFGTKNFTMSSEDFNLGPFPSPITPSNNSSSSSSSSSSSGTSNNPSMCLGAVFELTLAGASKDLISWVIGDSFLKNVLSIYRYTPPSVGFGKLKIPPFNQTSSTSINVNGTLFNSNSFKFIDFNSSSSSYFNDSLNGSLALFDQKENGIGFDKKSNAIRFHYCIRYHFVSGFFGLLIGFWLGFF